MTKLEIIDNHRDIIFDLYKLARDWEETKLDFEDWLEYEITTTELLLAVEESEDG